jgi:hypothetical protein
VRAAQPLTHVEALELGTTPQHLVVLGGGYIGLEFAQPMRRFGARATVVEQAPQIAGHEDADVARDLMERFQQEGIAFVIGARVERVEGRSGQRVRLHVRGDAGAQVIEGSHLLVAAGACLTRRGSDWKRPVSRWMGAATCRSTSGWRHRRPVSGQWATAPAARSSRTWRSMAEGFTARFADPPTVSGG